MQSRSSSRSLASKAGTYLNSAAGLRGKRDVLRDIPRWYTGNWGQDVVVSPLVPGQGLTPCWELLWLDSGGRSLMASHHQHAHVCHFPGGILLAL